MVDRGPFHLSYWYGARTHLAGNLIPFCVYLYQNHWHCDLLISKYLLNSKLNRPMHDNEAQLLYFTCLFVTVLWQFAQMLHAQ